MSTAGNAPSTPSPLAPADYAESNAVLRWIVRLRWFIFAVLAFLLVAGHNGRWRVGRDSSLYRDVARNLVEGRGYTYRGVPERHIFPGLPLLLAAIDKVFGPQDPLYPRAALVIVMTLGGLTLIIVYKLIRTYYPPWIAVCVTTGVGINHLFVGHCHELMSDLPFLTGVCLLLLGIARCGKAGRVRNAIAPALLAIAGATIAIAMRPTFWALAIACAATCAVGLFRSHRRLPYAVGFILIPLIVAGWWYLDPRLGGSLLNGKYEATTIQHLRGLGGVDWPDRIGRTFDTHLPEALFGFELLRPMGMVLAPLTLALSFLIMRKSVLWGMYVLVTLVMTVVLGNQPRYFMMILPLLLLEWALVVQSVAIIVQWVAQRFTRIPGAAEAVVLFGLGAATIINLGLSANIVLEQHGITRRFQRSTFLAVYRGGKMLPLVQMSEAIREHVPPGQTVLGPEPRILTFLGRRNVYHISEALPRRQSRWRQTLKRGAFDYCIWGLPDEVQMNTLLRPGRPYVTIDRASTVEAGGMFLARMSVAEPPPRRPARRPVRPATRPATQPALIQPGQRLP